jgi:glycosyltransferase involved in cell wall biosynthesis
MKKQKNIFFFLPNFSIGGAGNSVTNICKIVASKNYNITVFSIGKNLYKKDLLLSRVNVIELKKQKTILAIFKIIKYFTSKYKNEKIIFVSNINYANVLSCIFIKRIKKLKLILIERTPIQELQIYFSLTEIFRKKLILILLKLFYSRADFIIGNSKKLSIDLSKKINCKIQTINPYISIKNIKKKYNKVPRLVWIGRNSPEKNIDDFISSLQFINNLNIKILIVTDKDFNNLKDKIPKLFKKNTKFIKFNKNNDSIVKIYKKSDILVNTSLYEGFPNVIAEAINHKCLIITSDSFGGKDDLIKNEKYGLIYETKNFKELSKKIIFAVKHFKECKNKINLAKKNLIHIAKENNIKYINFFKNIN